MAAAAATVDRGLSCEQCQTPLTGKQRRWCGPVCRSDGTRAQTNKAYGDWREGRSAECEHCGGPLTGRQVKWCSLKCKSDHGTEIAYVNDLAVHVRKCNKCGLQKPLAVDFYRAPNGGFRRTCRSCVMAGNKERSARPDAADKKRNLHLVSLYGITVEEYEELLRAQGGTCAVCGKPPVRMRLAVDHDHVTGLIRGLLCSYCNLRIVGKVRDSRLYHAAADYLDSPPARAVIGEHTVPKRPPKKRASRKPRRKKAV